MIANGTAAPDTRYGLSWMDVSDIATHIRLQVFSAPWRAVGP